MSRPFGRKAPIRLVEALPAIKRQREPVSSDLGLRKHQNTFQDWVIV